MHVVLKVQKSDLMILELKIICHMSWEMKQTLFPCYFHFVRKLVDF